jgi:hypothetical protein
MRRPEWLCAVLGVCLGLLIAVAVRGQYDELARELEVLRASNEQLKQELTRRGQDATSDAVGQRPTATSASARVTEGRLASAVALHGEWHWDLLVKSLMQPFQRITPQMLDAAVQTCYDNGTMYCLRAQVSRGRLYITDYRAIFFDRFYAPSRVMPLLETLRRHPNLPDVDIVVAAVDEPRVKTLVDAKWWTRLCTRYPGGTHNNRIELPPPLFSSTISRHHLDLPWLDFSFFMPRKEHKLRTPPWSVLHPQMLEQSARVRWEDKIELAMHTGNVGSPFRQRLARVAEKHPSTMLVNELFSTPPPPAACAL